MRFREVILNVDLHHLIFCVLINRGEFFTLQIVLVIFYKENKRIILQDYFLNRQFIFNSTLLKTISMNKSLLPASRIMKKGIVRGLPKQYIFKMIRQIVYVRVTIVDKVMERRMTKEDCLAFALGWEGYPWN